jgi:pilus assembly protein CpaF
MNESTSTQSGAEAVPQDIHRVKQWMVEQIIAELPEEQTWHRTPESTRLVTDRFIELYRRAGPSYSEADQKKLFSDVVDDVLGYGPIQQFLDDPEVSEVMVNGPKNVWVERAGRLSVTDVCFENDDEVMRLARRILGPMGREVDRSRPRADGRLPDGHRVNIIVPPCAIDGPTITIRKFPEDPLRAEDLIRLGTLTEQAAEFLRACVNAALNIVVSGGTGSGKTTVLNVLSSYIPDRERIVTIEDAAELQLLQPHVVRLETSPALPDGTGRMDIRELVINSLRMRPDRIVIGECRGGEALDMLQAMNTGHDGSLTTVHANNPRDCVARLETLCLMAGLDLPAHVIRQQIVSAVDLIVQQSRMRDGSRKILQMTEVQRLEGDAVVLQDLFLYQAPPFTGEGEATGRLEPTGIRPNFLPRLEEAGFKLGGRVFGTTGFLVASRR